MTKGDRARNDFLSAGNREPKQKTTKQLAAEAREREILAHNKPARDPKAETEALSDIARLIPYSDLELMRKDLKALHEAQPAVLFEFCLKLVVACQAWQEMFLEHQPALLPDVPPTTPREANKKPKTPGRQVGWMVFDPIKGLTFEPVEKQLPIDFSDL